MDSDKIAKAIRNAGFTIAGAIYFGLMYHACNLGAFIQK